ncbi:cyclase [Pontibacter cellulosilyticus]|uniref:Cyclase n=1 Tax=Pontibacter cellulosilyticus TaxID=1720253 RepID=A0A923N3X7_9BACT|nr:cyclase [Pontibacter cellulosilyticus]MBC5992053.1 cyclase [Pontibacter cellulosilyticus]
MGYLLIRHEVNDFDHWKTAYNEHKGAREKAGLRDLYLLQNKYNHNEVVILFETENDHRAQDFIESEDLKKAMERAGVVGMPEIRMLEGESAHV